MGILALFAVAAVVFGLCWLRIRCMPEPVYDLPRWWYLLWIVWLPRLTGQLRHRRPVKITNGDRSNGLRNHLFPRHSSRSKVTMLGL